MGIDSCVYYKAKGDVRPYLVDPDARIEPADKDCSPTGATHEVSGLDRYYSEGYERGYWPRLCGVLLALMGHDGIEKVWYSGDAMEPEDMELMTVDKLERLTRHWINSGGSTLF